MKIQVQKVDSEKMIRVQALQIEHSDNRISANSLYERNGRSRSNLNIMTETSTGRRRIDMMTEQSLSENDSDFKN